MTEINRFVEMVGDYSIDRELGRGAHGVVFLAHHKERPEQPVALKLVQNRGSLDRLMLEPAILSELNHTGIVGLHDFFLDDERVVIVLEYIADGDLERYAQDKGMLNPDQVREFLVQVARALEHAHTAGVLHRDIKLSNILVELRENGDRFVLTDFGISRMSEPIQIAKHTGGTYFFMAPEQLLGRPTAQSDLWALGVVAYRLLTGRLPFEADSLEDLAHAVRFKTPIPPSEIRVDLEDTELEQLIFSMLEKQQSQRIVSAKELLTALGAKDQPIDLPPVQREGERQIARRNFDRRMDKRIRFSWVAFWVCAVLWFGPLLIVPNLLVIAAIYLFYSGQLSDRTSIRIVRTFGGLILVFASWFAMELFVPSVVAPLVSTLGINASSLAWYYFVVGSKTAFSLVCAPAAAYFYLRIRRARRERDLRRSILASTRDQASYLANLKSMLSERSEDTILHQKYAEALLASGKTREAVVEGILILDSDPFNVGAGLLVAHSYAELKLADNVVEVCDRFLAFAGYCFEFEELKRNAVAALEGEKS